jgi:hypothetical protein
MMGDNMLGTKEDFITLTAPQVLEERNRLIAARVCMEIGFGAGKMQKLLAEVNLFSHDPRQIVELLYKKIWPINPNLSRDYIQKLVNVCHADAFETLQQVHLTLLGRRDERVHI